MSKILIIEDEASIRRVLTKILSEESDSYLVDEAEDGVQGLEKIKNTDYDLVLCDIKMPKMDGVELLEAVKKQDVSEFFFNYKLMAVDVQSQGLDLQFQEINVSHQTLALIGADGLNSRVRSSVFESGAPVSSGHWAYRALLPMSGLPQAFQKSHVGIWMGKRLHVVHYPVRSGQWLNVVAIVHGDKPAQADAWDSAGHTQALMQAMGAVGKDLHERLASVPAWRQWALHDREPLSASRQMAQGRVALLGDAAHPMRPYLAQGAGMAIEDAAVLARCLQRCSADDAKALLQYASLRWKRNARALLRRARLLHTVRQPLQMSDRSAS